LKVTDEMKAQQRYSYMITTDEATFDRISAQVSHEAKEDKRVEIVAVADKTGYNILVLHSVHQPHDYANGAKATVLEANDIDYMKTGMIRRSLEKRIAELEREHNGKPAYTGNEVLAAMKDVTETLSVVQPQMLVTAHDINLYGQSLAYATLQLVDGKASQKELEAQLKQAEDDKEKAVGERDIALRDLHVISQKGQIHLSQKAELEKKVEEYENNTVVKKIEREYSAAKSELQKVQQATRRTEERLKELERERTAFFDAMRVVKSNLERERTKGAQFEGYKREKEAEIAQLKSISTRLRGELDDVNKHLREYIQSKPQQLYNVPTRAEPVAITERGVTTPRILIPDPLAETTEQLFGYVAFKRANDSDRQIVSRVFNSAQINSHRAIGRAKTPVYFFGGIDAKLESILSELIQHADASRTAEQMQSDICEYFTAGDQCGYNLNLWRERDGRIDKFTIALVARLALATVENKLHMAHLSPMQEHEIAKITPIFFQLAYNGVKRPREVYKP